MFLSPQEVQQTIRAHEEIQKIQLKKKERKNRRYHHAPCCPSGLPGPPAPPCRAASERRRRSPDKRRRAERCDRRCPWSWRQRRRPGSPRSPPGRPRWWGTWGGCWRPRHRGTGNHRRNYYRRCSRDRGRGRIACRGWIFRWTWTPSPLERSSGPRRWVGKGELCWSVYGGDVRPGGACAFMKRKQRCWGWTWQRCWGSNYSPMWVFRLRGIGIRNHI